MTCACCQPPPPGGCACEDTCAYFIGLTGPLSVKHGPYQCGSPEVKSEATAASLIKDLLPFELTGQENFPATLNLSKAVSVNDGSSLAVGVSHGARGFIDGSIFGSNQFAATSDANISVFCSVDGNGIRRYYASLASYASGNIFFDSLGVVTTGYWTRSYYGQFEIPSTCIVAPEKSCANLSTETLHINLPLTITMSANGTSSLGGLSLVLDSGYGQQSDVAKGAVESILAGLSYTVNITSKPSCRSVSAICDVPLEGNRIVAFGTAEDKNFVLGVSKSTTTGPIANDLTWTYEHFGPADGTTQNPYVFNAKLTNENNRIIAEHNVELFCDGGQSGGQWYVRESIYCTPEQGQETEDQWIGIVESYASANDCNEIAAGDPVPIGTPYYEHVDGYPIVNFGDPCVPPSPIGLEITAYCP